MDQEILDLQRKLRAEGFDPGTLDGIDGPKTQAALKAYNAAQPKSTGSALYTITNGWINEVDHKVAKGYGGNITPELLVIHFTAGHPYQCAEYFAEDPDNRQVSAHIVIEPNGHVIQCVPFNRAAWHTGRASYKGLSVNNSCNNFSIGIELENYGNVTEKNGKFFGYSKEIPADTVIKAAHRNEPGVIRPWQKYTPAQVKACVEVGKAITTYYGIKDITGHDVISPTNKNDPGPAWDMPKFVKDVLG